MAVTKEDMERFMNQLRTDMLQQASNVAKAAASNVLESAQACDKIEKSFDRKRHEDQYKHNNSVNEKIDEAMDNLEGGDIEAGEPKLKEGRSLIKQRKKLSID